MCLIPERGLNTNYALKGDFDIIGALPYKTKLISGIFMFSSSEKYKLLIIKLVKISVYKLQK